MRSMSFQLLNFTCKPRAPCDTLTFTSLGPQRPHFQPPPKPRTPPPPPNPRKPPQALREEQALAQRPPVLREDLRSDFLEIRETPKVLFKKKTPTWIASCDRFSPRTLPQTAATGTEKNDCNLAIHPLTVDDGNSDQAPLKWSSKLW